MTRSGVLEPETARLVRISAALATGDSDRIREALAGASQDAHPRAVEEILLQSHLFLGFPAALEALALWRDVWGRPAPDSGEGPGAESSGEDEPAVRRARGEGICRIVYGEQYEALRRNIRALHPAMERWMLEEGYGRVLGRAGLDLKRRELAIAALLAVLGARTQLHSHLRGALRAGAAPEAVEAALRTAEEYQDEETRTVARNTWDRVRGRWDRAARRDR